MTIAEKDVKKLWGLAAGACSYPNCGASCLVFIDGNDPTLIGEMSHVIAKQPAGPRGQAGGGSDDYTNLILLCPNHHRLIDKAPEGTFAEATLLSWKSEHETRMQARREVPSVSSKHELCGLVERLLIENHATWQAYGPESDAAEENPISNVAQLWTLRKLAEVIPRNTTITNLLHDHQHLFTAAEYRIAARFIEHAAGFEASAYERRENVPRFPPEFEEMIRHASAVE